METQENGLKPTETEQCKTVWKQLSTHRNSVKRIEKRFRNAEKRIETQGNSLKHTETEQCETV